MTTATADGVVSVIGDITDSPGLAVSVSGDTREWRREEIAPP
jgi:hypothetical protein